LRSGTLLKAKAAIAHETVTAVVKLIVLSALATVGDMTINRPCNAIVAYGEMRSLAKENAIAQVFTPLELRAKHRNANADVESDTAIVIPTRVATIKRFMIGPFQFGLIIVSTPKRREQIVHSAAVAHPGSTYRPCRSCAGRYRAGRRLLRGTKASHIPSHQYSPRALA
jgi:hypothetical protein